MCLIVYCQIVGKENLKMFQAAVNCHGQWFCDVSTRRSPVGAGQAREAQFHFLNAMIYLFLMTAVQPVVKAVGHEATGSNILLKSRFFNEI
jgi:hypothetical protein